MQSKISSCCNCHLSISYFQYTAFGSCELMFLYTRFHKYAIKVARAAILDLVTLEK